MSVFKRTFYAGLLISCFIFADTKQADLKFKKIYELESIPDNLKDELLYHQGLLAQEPLFTYYWVKFETEKKYFSISTLNWSRTLRFKIAERDALHSLQSETVKDAQLVLLNKSGFEIKRTPVGTVEAFKKVTGKIDLTETEYKELYSVELHN